MPNLTFYINHVGTVWKNLVTGTDGVTGGCYVGEAYFHPDPDPEEPPYYYMRYRSVFRFDFSTLPDNLHEIFSATLYFCYHSSMGGCNPSEADHAPIRIGECLIAYIKDYGTFGVEDWDWEILSPLGILIPQGMAPPSIRQKDVYSCLIAERYLGHDTLCFGVKYPYEPNYTEGDVYCYNYYIGKDPCPQERFRLEIECSVLEPFEKNIDVRVLIVHEEIIKDVDIRILIIDEEVIKDIDIQVQISNEFSKDIDIRVEIQHRLEKNIDIQVFIPFFKKVDVQVQISSEFSKNIDIRSFIVAHFQEDIDLEIYAGYTDTPFQGIQILLDGVVYDLGPDEISKGIISQALQKKYGVSKISDVRILLENTHQKYSKNYPSSLIYEKDHIWTWVRIVTGWGPKLETDEAIQFQGKVFEFATHDNYTCSIIGYDPIKDLMEYSIDYKTTPKTFNNNLVDSSPLLSLSPLHIIKYLIEEEYEKDGVPGLKRFNFDTLVEEDIIDTTSFDLAYEATLHTEISSTIFNDVQNLLSLIQDLLKIVGAYMYTARDGKLAFYAPSPERSWGVVNQYTGDVDSDPRQLLSSHLKESYTSIFNTIVWKAGADGTTIGTYRDSDSIGKFGEKTLDITTKWEIEVAAVLDLSEKLLTRFSQPIDVIEGELTYIEDGKALNEVLGNIVKLTDPAHSLQERYFEIIKLGKNLSQERVGFTAQDAIALEGKFMLACSDIDEGDGYGITSGNFDLWIHRLGFAGGAYSDDPHYGYGGNFEVGFDPDGNNNGVINPDYGTQDKWGNGIEEIFVAW